MYEKDEEYARIAQRKDFERQCYELEDKKDGIIMETDCHKNIGDIVKYYKKGTSFTSGNVYSPKILTGKVIDVFKSMDKSFWCYWIEDETDLITEYSILEN